jgi:hypothetical protein
MAAFAAAVVVSSARAAGAVALQVFGRHVAHGHHFHLEVQRLARHRVVEVHLHRFVAHFFHHAHHAVALGVAHRYLRALEQDVFGYLAVYHEYVFRQVHHRFGHVFAVSVLGFQRERHFLARFLAFDRRLEFRQQHPRPEDEFEGLFRARLVGDLSVYGQFVVYTDHLVLFCFHCFSVF